jgi:hypothetical protein
LNKIKENMPKPQEQNKSRHAAADEECCDDA